MKQPLRLIMQTPAQRSRMRERILARVDLNKEVSLSRDEYNFRASAIAHKIFNAQVQVALGSHLLIALVKDEDGKLSREIVRDIARQEKFIEQGEYGVEYIITEGAPPDWRAGEAILNRPFGKPKENLDLKVETKFSLVELARQRDMLDGNPDVTEIPPSAGDISSSAI